MRANQAFVEIHVASLGMVRVAYAEIESVVNLRDEAELLSRYLASCEFPAYEELRAIDRRRGWLAGRILAKTLLAQACEKHGLGLLQNDEVAIRSRFCRGRSARPVVDFLKSQPMNWDISLAHSEKIVFAALVPKQNLRVGIDVVDRQSLGNDFIDTWFSPHEIQTLGLNEGNHRAGQAWAIKEAIYKAANQGEGFSPLAVKIERRISDDIVECSYCPVRSNKATEPLIIQACCLTDDCWDAALALSDVPGRGIPIDAEPALELGVTSSWQQRFTRAVANGICFNELVWQTASPAKD